MTLHFHRWRTVRDTGVNVYQDCRCGKRRVTIGGTGYQPVDQDWLLTGAWTPLPMQDAPQTPYGLRRL